MTNHFLSVKKILSSKNLIVVLMLSISAEKICAANYETPKIPLTDDQFNQLNKSSDQKEACQNAEAAYDDLIKNIKEDCDSFGLKNCLSKAAECDTEGEGDGSNSLGSFASLGASLLGGGTFNSGSSELDGINCRMGKDQIIKWKDMQKDLYDEAKDARKDAQDRVKEIQDGADDLTNQKADMAKEFQTTLKEIKNMNAELPRTLRKIKDDVLKQMKEARDSLNSAIQEQAQREAEVTSSQGLITTAYARNFGPCLDLKTQDKISTNKDLLELQQKAEDDMGKIIDLRQRNSRIKALKKILNAKIALAQAEENSKYSICARDAQAKYTAETDALKLKITQNTNRLSQLKDDIRDLQIQIKELPQALAEAIKAAQDEAQNERNEKVANLQTANAKLAELTTNYNNRLNQSQQQLYLAQTNFLQKQMVYQSSAAVVEAGLGNVKPLLTETHTAQCVARTNCSGIGSYKTKVPDTRACDNYDSRPKVPSDLQRAIDGEVSQ